ncbi:putative FMN-dependent luciferase-like monooxygenase [Paenochrobactrum pullorum]|uniref:putative FMN-dependent luciferase-like monooxygenase n=1 Tax=Paenochrobactrum pullorum TaxID=1324351 RepID=UPI0035BC8162
MTISTKPKRLGFFTRVLDQADAGERYRLVSEQIIHAEKHGFDSAWVAQHHFHADEGGLPSPAVFLAHVGARTSHIRLGTGVITLPMENAIRVAEDTSVLDLLSNGRLEVGFGTGGTRESFETFGVDSDKRGEVYAANLQLVRDAWSGIRLNGGNHLYPTAPHLINHVWLATFSALGSKLAGLSGDGLMLSRTQPRDPQNPDASLSDIQNPIIDAYLNALPEGKTPRILGSRSLFVAEDRKRALQLAEYGLSDFAAKMAARGLPVQARNVEDLIRVFDSHVGTPDDVIASLKQDTALPRSTDLVFQVHSIDPPHEDILRSIELTAQYVAPALGWHKQLSSKLVAAE